MIGLMGLTASVGVAFALYKMSQAQAEEWNETEFPPLYGKWSRSFMCMRCGMVTDPAG